MSVQRWDSYESTPSPTGRYILHADHARIVAERVAEVTDALIDARREALAEMEQAHAAALAELREEYELDAEREAYSAAARILAEREKHAAALAEAVSVIEGLADQQAMYDGWYVEPLERLRAAAAAAPRTLTADEGYHSQRCLHCDHIRATHTLTAHGCIGHALPGRPGADCPCAEFIHDGEATPQDECKHTHVQPYTQSDQRPWCVSCGLFVTVIGKEAGT